MNKPIRVLHVLGTVDLGGAESRIMDLYRNIDRRQVQFDFAVHTNVQGFFEQEIKQLGGNIYHFPRFKVYNIVHYIKAWKSFFHAHKEIKAVHGHMTSTASLYLRVAKKQGINLCIAHARSAGVDQGIKGIFTKVLRRNLSRYSDYCFACSSEAGLAVFGTRSEKKIHIIPNAIEALKYDYKSDVRDRVREELHITDAFVVGHVGRFHFAKNHKFIIQIFAECLRREQNCVLLLLGDGPLREEINKMTTDFNINDKVMFLGNKVNVEDYYQAMDCLLFPSFFEGLPGTLIEAQTSGLPCVISDKITKESILNFNISVLSLHQDIQEWVNALFEKKGYVRKSMYDNIKIAGFDVKDQSIRIMKFYQTGILEEYL